MAGITEGLRFAEGRVGKSVAALRFSLAFSYPCWCLRTFHVAQLLFAGNFVNDGDILVLSDWQSKLKLTVRCAFHYAHPAQSCTIALITTCEL